MTTLKASELAPGDFIRHDGEILRLHRVPVNPGASFSVGFIKKGTKGQNIGDLVLEGDEPVEVLARWPALAGGWKY